MIRKEVGFSATNSRVRWSIREPSVSSATLSTSGQPIPLISPPPSGPKPTPIHRRSPKVHRKRMFLCPLDASSQCPFENSRHTTFYFSSHKHHTSLSWRFHLKSLKCTSTKKVSLAKVLQRNSVRANPIHSESFW